MTHLPALFLKVTLDLGSVHFEVLTGSIEPIPYFKACLKFNPERKAILVPDLSDYSVQVVPDTLMTLMDFILAGGK